MSKKKNRKRVTPARAKTSKGRLIGVVIILVALAVTGAIVTQHASLWGTPGIGTATGTSPARAPQSPPPALGKEYIHSVGKLVATEEPTGGGGGGCMYSISPTSQLFTATGGSNSVGVTAGSGCAWTATSNAAWINITAGSSGSGNGTVNYSVLANTGSARSSTMTIAGQTFTVNQDAATSCMYSISPTSQSFTASGGSNSVGVTAGVGCNWTATSNAAWINITAGSSGSGNGTVNYSVASNSGSARNGTMTIAGQTFTVNQDAATSCMYSINPTSQLFTATGGSNSVGVTAGSGCAWTATSNAAWINITAGSSGSGNGTVNYSVLANTGSARNGTMTIAGQTFTVNQDAAGGGPSAHSLSLNGSSQYVTVPNSSTINITASITIEAWIKTNSATQKQTIISRYRPEVTSGFEGGYRLRITNTGTVVFATYKNASNFVEVTSAASVSAGVWTHVAGVFDGSTMRVFINGAQSGLAVSNFNPRNGTSSLYIGVNPDGIQKFNGLLDEVRVTAAAVYTSNFTPQTSLTTVTGTAGLWKFDSQTAADTSGNNNNGALVGSPTFSTDVPGGGSAMNIDAGGQDAIVAAAPINNREITFGEKVWMWLGLGYRVMKASSPLV